MTAYNETFEKVYAQAGGFIEPVVKTNKLAVANFEKLVDFQFKAMQKYVDFGLAQMKAAAEVDSPKAWQAYVGQQVEAANTVRQLVLGRLQSFHRIKHPYERRPNQIGRR